MARTSRGSTPAAASVDALDNLDLDDMFNEGNDDLFNDLDLDLGAIDDITSGSTKLQVPLSAPTRMDPAPDNDVSHAPNDSPKRRKTKRKSKTPSIYDEENDGEIEPPKKKKVTGKAGAAKKGKATSTPPAPPQTAAAEDETSRSSHGSSKTKNRSSISVQNPPIRATSAGVAGVAAAGQFGRRGGSFSLQKGRSKLPTRGTNDFKSKIKSVANNQPGDSSAPLPPDATSSNQNVPGNLAQILATHPGLNQNPFCGLMPSSTVFYPFMPALPAELTMKNRKIYALMERLHSSFVSLQGSRTSPTGVIPVKETEAIFKLLQDAYREVSSGAHIALTPDRILQIGIAVGTLRRTVSLFEKMKLVGDLFALSSLIKKQHDFLKQNMDNMKNWCRNNLPDEEYTSVFVQAKQKKRKAAEEPSQVSVIRTMGSSLIKVRISCAGFKEPKVGNILLAQIPGLPGKPSSAIDLLPPVGPPKKKRKLGETAKAIQEVPLAKPPKETSYSENKPSKRRMLVSDLIIRTARELESRLFQQHDERRQQQSKQETDMRKLADEDGSTLIHTAAMWRWLDKSNTFTVLTEKDVRERLEIIRSPEPFPEESHHIATSSPSEPRSLTTDSIVDRLTSLLVDEDVHDDDDDDDDNQSDSSVVLSDLADDFFDEHETMIDLSSLDVNEKCALHLNAVGLLNNFSNAIPGNDSYNDEFSRTETSACNLSDGQSAKNAENGKASPKKCDVEEVLDNMTRELVRLDTLNNRRGRFLESLAMDSVHFYDGSKRKKEEAITIARLQQLLKRQKEMKSKTGKTKPIKDEMSLLW